MIKFGPFRKKFHHWRMSQFNDPPRDIAELKELPHGIILHVLDNFGKTGIVNYGPALDNIVLAMNKNKLFMYNITVPESHPTDVVPVSMNKMVMTNSGVMQQLMLYKRDMSPRVMFVNGPNMLPVRSGVTDVINYNALFRARVLGVRRKVRQTNFIFANLVNTLMRCQDRMHYIHIPIESLIFQRNDFIKVFKKFDRIATKYPEIPTYLFLAHLYAWLMLRMTLPKRGEIDESEELDAVEAFKFEAATWVDDTPDMYMKNVVDALMSDSDVALEALKEFKPDENPYTNTIFEYIPPRMLENINFILTCGTKYICINMRDLKELNGNGNGLLRIIKGINNLAVAGHPVAAETPLTPEEQTATEEPPMVAESITTVDETGEKPNQPEFTTPLTKEEREDANACDMAELDNVDKIIDKVATQKTNKPMSQAQKERVRVIGKAYKKLTINGKTFEQLLAQVPNDDLDMSTIELEATKDGSLDKVATASSIASLDATYVQKTMDRDLAAIATSFNKQGMFLTEFKEDVVADALNEFRTYVAKYEDTSHKTHTLKFSIPKVDKFGRAKIGGVIKTMEKQRVSNPICKVSKTRVTLNSNYNKLLVERNENVAHSFMSWFQKSVESANKQGFKMVLHHDPCKFPNKAFPFEITEIGYKYDKITFQGGFLYFNLMNRGNVMPKDYLEKAAKMEMGNGVWFGHKGSLQFYITVTGQVIVKDAMSDSEPFFGAFLDFMEWLTGCQFSPMVEYIEMTVLSRVVPAIHLLGYKYGLTEMLKYTGADYEISDAGSRFERRTSDIVIRFKDKRLVIHRNPRNNALLFGGLCIYDLSDVYLEDMDSQDIYYELLSQKKISPNLIKGIDALFDLFIDPITKDVLREMREPTDLRDLILRAITMLTTSEHNDPASAVNFRFRGVEQMTGIIYNEMARAFANYRNHNPGQNNHFSMKEFEIKKRIIKDQNMRNIDTINPMDDIKSYSSFSNTGTGGRSNETFMIEDRQFTEDSVGIVSEATVDNGKVGLNAMLPANPLLRNSRGMTSKPSLKDMKPENMLSITSLVMPCVTQDDGKRANFVNIQASHVVPIAESEVSRVRTGFEEIVAQRTTNSCFSYAAEEEGVVQEIDRKTNLMIIRYKSGKKVALPFGDVYTSNSGNGFHMDQQIEINNFKKGEKFKKGDIITYNKQYFAPDPYTKQVRWKIGILAKVALIDNGGTIEDASILTQPLCDRMTFNPVHVKRVELKRNTNVHMFADVGTGVISTDPIIVFDESAMDLGGEDDPELTEMLGNLNKTAPKAGYTGTIAQINVLYKCSISNMSSSLQKLVKHVTALQNAQSETASKCDNSDAYRKAGSLSEGTDRLGLTDITPDTVIIEFYIKQNMGMNPGDKLFFDSSLKSVCSTVYPDSILTEDGEKIDACTSCRGILARIICSPFLTGLTNSVLEKLETNILDVWDGKEPVDQNKR